MAVIGSMGNFNPHSESWVLYQEQLEQFFAIKKISAIEGEDRRVAALLSLIGSDTYNILRDLCTPDLPSKKQYKELCALLKTHFSPKVCVFRERIDFYEAKENDGETISNWFARIHNLSTNCEFGGQLQSILKDKFICGLSSGRIRDRLCEENKGKKLDILLEIA